MSTFDFFQHDLWFSLNKKYFIFSSWGHSATFWLYDVYVSKNVLITQSAPTEFKSKMWALWQSHTIFYRLPAPRSYIWLRKIQRVYNLSYCQKIFCMACLRNCNNLFALQFCHPETLLWAKIKIDRLHVLQPSVQPCPPSKKAALSNNVY